jgi:3'(2'), 5'-bisphosphate nucleotidase
MATEHDHIEAERIATETGHLLNESRDRLFALGLSSWRIGDEGDRAAHNFIVDELRAAFPHDTVLSEEGADPVARLTAERVWIVDPVDGTREFGERGRTDWAVHIALTESGVATAGAVALPAVGITHSTHTPSVLPPRKDGPPRLAVSRTRASGAAMVVAEALDGQFISLGSAGAKAMAVVMGYADIYAHSGGQYEWDNCAPAVVAEAAGLHVSRIDGSEMRFNERDPWSPDFLFSRPEFAKDALAALAAAIR